MLKTSFFVNVLIFFGVVLGDVLMFLYFDMHEGALRFIYPFYAFASIGVLLLITDEAEL